MVRREHAQGVSRPIGQQPLVERHDRVVGLLEPSAARACSSVNRPGERLARSALSTADEGMHSNQPPAPSRVAKRPVPPLYDQVTGIGSIGHHSCASGFTRRHHRDSREHLDQLRRLAPAPRVARSRERAPRPRTRPRPTIWARCERVARAASCRLAAQPSARSRQPRSIRGQARSQTGHQLGASSVEKRARPTGSR